MTLKFKMAICLAAFAGLCGAMPAFAQSGAVQEPNLEVGKLTCNGTGSVGLILGSRQRLACEFTSVSDARPQRYNATITRVGLDVGATGSTVMIWSVLARSPGVPRGALAGRYAGVSGSASVGAGVGANILVGGSRNSFTLQPLSVQVQSGVNLAAGVAGLRLSAVK